MLENAGKVTKKKQAGKCRSRICAGGQDTTPDLRDRKKRMFRMKGKHSPVHTVKFVKSCPDFSKFEAACPLRNPTSEHRKDEHFVGIGQRHGKLDALQVFLANELRGPLKIAKIFGFVWFVCPLREGLQVSSIHSVLDDNFHLHCFIFLETRVAGFPHDEQTPWEPNNLQQEQ